MSDQQPIPGRTRFHIDVSAVMLNYAYAFTDAYVASENKASTLFRPGEGEEGNCPQRLY